MKAREVAILIEELAPLSSGMPGDDLGFSHGNPESVVTGVVTCWSPTLPVIRKTLALGASLIISHEALYYRREWSGDGEIGGRWFEEAEDSAKKVNRRRAALLDKGGISVYRAHSNWDIAPRIGVRDALASELGLENIVGKDRYMAVYDIPPVELEELARHVSRKLKAGRVRVTGSFRRKVRRVGLVYGGLAQMFNSPEAITNLGAEVAVAGECLAYTLHHAVETGLSVIEAGHCATENPGMRALTRWLGEVLGNTPVTFLDSGRPWKHLIR